MSNDNLSFQEKDNLKRLVEQVLFVLSLVPGMTQYTLYKVLYFADRKYLSKYGIPLVHTAFYAWEYGPVPKKLYYALKHPNGLQIEDRVFAEAVRMGKKDASDRLFPLREPDFDYIAKAEVETLRESVEENANCSFEDLKNRSHDIAWHNAYSKAPQQGVLTHHDMVLAEGDSEEYADYIAERDAFYAAVEQWAR